MPARGVSFNNKIHQMIWSCSLLKWLSIHALGFYYGYQIRKISTFQNKRKFLFFILKTKKKWLSVVKGLSDACIKVDAHTKDDACMAWNGIDDDVAWIWNHCCIIYIISEKYNKLVKIRKLAKYGNSGPSILKRMPTTNGLLKKMPTTHGDIVGCFFVYSTMVSVFPKRPWRIIYGPTATMV